MMTTELNEFADTASTQAGGTEDLCGEKTVQYEIDSQPTSELEG